MRRTPKYQRNTKTSVNFDTRIVENKVEKVVDNVYDKSIWGPKLWDTMHLFSYNYKEKPSKELMDSAWNFFISMGMLIPCAECQDHYKKFVSRFTPMVNSRDELIEWVLSFHNAVNQRKEKRLWSRQELDQKFETDNKFCG